MPSKLGSRNLAAKAQAEKEVVCLLACLLSTLHRRLIALVGLEGVRAVTIYRLQSGSGSASTSCQKVCFAVHLHRARSICARGSCDRSRASASVRAGGDDAADEDQPLSNLANGFDKADAQERIKALVASEGLDNLTVKKVLRTAVGHCCRRHRMHCSIPTLAEYTAVTSRPASCALRLCAVEAPMASLVVDTCGIGA